MIRYLLSVILLFCMQHTICAQTAHWITADHADRDVPNTWIEFHKDIALTGKPKEVYAQIAADTKYWLWINESLVVSPRRDLVDGHGATGEAILTFDWSWQDGTIWYYSNPHFATSRVYQDCKEWKDHSNKSRIQAESWQIHLYVS